MSRAPGSDQGTVDTAPQAAIDLPPSAAVAGRAAGEVSSVLLIRSVAAGVASVILVVVAALLFVHGVRPDDFPGYATGATRTVITRYSAPWIAGSAVVALLAGLSFVSSGVDLFRRIRLQRARRGVS